MGGYLPPDFPFLPPPPPAHSMWSPPPPPSPTSHRPFRPELRGNNATSPGGVIAGVVIGVGAFLLVLSIVCAAYAVTTTAVPMPRPALPERLEPSLRGKRWRHHDQSPGTTRSSSCVATAATVMTVPHSAQAHGKPPVVHVQPSCEAQRDGKRGREAATCSVCLGVFQVGETVRLLPVCLHLYHVECIDPWLEAHSTCPLCRLGTDDPTMHGSLLPAV